MGIQKSNLDKKKIKKLMLEQYGIFAEKISKVKGGTANIFKIDDKGYSYILKEFSTGISENIVIKEIEIVNFLRDRNIRVPEYIKLKNNQFYTKHKDNVIIVQKFIEGIVLNRGSANNEQLMEAAALLGKVALELKNFKELDKNKNWGSKQENRDRINKLKELSMNIKNSPYKERIIKDLEDKIRISESMDKKFDFGLLDKMTLSNSHGDYFNTQLIYDCNNKATVIDFEKARKMIISYEIIESFCSLDSDTEDGIINVDKLVKYFKEFSKYFKLNKYDLKYAPYIFLIRIVNSSYGYYEYNNDNSQVEILDFAFFRTRLSKYLYENLDYISLILVKRVLSF